MASETTIPALGHGRVALRTLPIIDVAPFTGAGTLEARRRAAAELRKACIDIGFFYITGHGIERGELNQLLALGHRFFELPEAEKARIDRKLSPGGQGYSAPGGTDGYGQGKVPDLKERLIMNREPILGEPEKGRFNAGESQWPDEKVLPGFAAFMKAHMKRRVALAQRLVRAFALSLELPEDHFDEMFRFPGGTMIFNYYPPTGALAEDQWNFSPHTDYGAFTLLLQDALGGLQARNSAGEWIDVPPIEGTFVVNLGDMFQMWTNDRYVSTLHRVVNSSRKARISVPFFNYPQGRTVIRCLPTCQGPDNPPRHEPVIAEDYNRMLAERAARTGRPSVSALTSKRLDA
jgi:isopenicillin N synthase-like dioxygenase